MREMIKKLVPGKLLDIYKRLRKSFITMEFGMFRAFPIRKKRVVLCNVWGFGDNPKWIAKALARADRSVEVIFVTDKAAAENVPGEIKIVENNTPRAIYYLATAHIWVDCNRKEPYIIKRSGQIYIQTWHGSLPLKKLEADYAGLTEEYMENARRDSKMTDLCLSNGEFMNDIYKTAFMYDCEAVITGSARMDPLIRPNAKRVQRTKKHIARLAGIADYSNMKLAVYAPTYRENGQKIDFPDLGQVREALKKRFGGEFVIVARVHPLVRGSAKVQAEGIVDGNYFSDLYELLEASQILITDYSNTMFEFACAGRTVFLYATDSREYEAERGFYFDYAGLPYPHSSSTKELCGQIEDFSEFDYKTGLKGFFKDLGIREDGRASRRIAELILRKVYRS